MKADFTYIQDAGDGWYSLIPENETAVAIYNQLSDAVGPGRLPPTWFSSIRSDLRKAGYSVRRAPTVTKADLDAILNDVL